MRKSASFRVLEVEPDDGVAGLVELGDSLVSYVRAL
jgi:hypothetical protein